MGRFISDKMNKAMTRLKGAVLMKPRTKTTRNKPVALLLPGGLCAALLLSGYSAGLGSAAAQEQNPGTSVVEVPTYLGYSLVFQEEFSANTLNNDVWLDEYFPHAYAADVDNSARYTLEDGILRLTIKEDSPGISAI